MLTSKRQIKRDSDRFGGFYSTETNEFPRISDFDISNNDTDIDADTSMRAESAAPEMNAQAPEAAAPAETPAPAPAETSFRSQRPHKEEDIRPTIKSLTYADAKPIEEIAREIEPKQEEVTQKRARPVLDTKMKILLCVYVVIALVLAIAVIATGVSISHASAEADIVAKSVAQKQQIISRQQRELEQLRDEDNIRAKALENGMVPAGDPDFSVSNVESVDYPEATPRTDGWDKWFDNMSKVFN